MANEEVANDFLARLMETGRADWSPDTPTRLASVHFGDATTSCIPKTRFLHREEAEAFQLSVVARARSLAPDLKADGYVLYNADIRTRNASHFLVIEYDKNQRPIRATDAWGMFRNNVGERMSHEFKNSRVAFSGVFGDDSPQRANLAVDTKAALVDLALMPLSVEKEFGPMIRENLLTPWLLVEISTRVYSEAGKRANQLDEIAKSIKQGITEIDFAKYHGIKYDYREPKQGFGF